MYLLLEHGDAKTARFCAADSHMGGQHAMAIIVDWLRRQLSAAG